MNFILRYILTLLGFAMSFAALAAITELYSYLRKKLNRPKYDQSNLSTRALKRGDYVYFPNRLLEFSHIARNGETIDPTRPPSWNNQSTRGDLMFRNSRSIGYTCYSSSILRQCMFVYGRFGLKWAITPEQGEIAEEIIKQLRYE